MESSEICNRRALEGFHREVVEHTGEERSLIQHAGPLEDRAARKLFQSKQTVWGILKKYMFSWFRSKVLLCFTHRCIL